jgi:hypothetical protein
MDLRAAPAPPRKIAEYWSLQVFLSSAATNFHCSDAANNGWQLAYYTWLVFA